MIVNVTELVSVVDRVATERPAPSPPAACREGHPPVEPVGCVVKRQLRRGTDRDGEARVLTAEVNPVGRAVNVYVPARSILQPTNVATPATAGIGFALVQLKTAHPAAVIANVTVLVSAVTVLPAAVLHLHHRLRRGTPHHRVEPLGCVVNANFAATPTVIVKRVADRRTSTHRSVAVNVYVPARSILQPTNVATPATAAFGLRWCSARRRPPGVVIVKVTALVFVGHRVATGVLHRHDRLRRERNVARRVRRAAS